MKTLVNSLSTVAILSGSLPFGPTMAAVQVIDRVRKIGCYSSSYVVFV